MKRSGSILSLLCVLLAGVIFSTASHAEEGSTFQVARLVISEGIVDREPVGVITTAGAGTQEVFCFLEATDIVDDTMVTFVWIHEGIQRGELTLPLNMGPRWRTYASKKLGSWSGNWTVELRDASGALIDSASFVAE